MCSPSKRIGWAVHQDYRDRSSNDLDRNGHINALSSCARSPSHDRLVLRRRPIRLITQLRQAKSIELVSADLRPLKNNSLIEQKYLQRTLSLNRHGVLSRMMGSRGYGEVPRMPVLKIAASCWRLAAEAETQAAQISDQHLKAVYLRIADQWSGSCILPSRLPLSSMQQLQQHTLVDRELLQWLALDARHDAGNEPARQTHLDDGDQRAVRFEGGEASAQVIQLLHGGAPSVHISADDATSSPLPHSISVDGTFTRWNGS